MKKEKSYSARYHGLNIKRRVISMDGCVEPLLHEKMISGEFSHAKENALLVGDAGGFIVPFIGEGISVGLRSGVSAAKAVILAFNSGKSAENN